MCKKKIIGKVRCLGDPTETAKIDLQRRKDDTEIGTLIPKLYKSGISVSQFKPRCQAEVLLYYMRCFPLKNPEHVSEIVLTEVIILV